MGDERANDQKPENIRALHAALVTQRATLNQLLWQAPVIALTAQAFLLTIAFGDQCDFYRIVSGLSAFAVGILSWQLFERHSALEIISSKTLRNFEKKYFCMTVHEQPVVEVEESGGHDLPLRSPASRSSRKLWGPWLFYLSFPGLLPLFEFYARSQGWIE